MSLVKIFNRIRDIPYKIPVSLKEKDFCCSGKHKLLKEFLEKEGYKVRYRVVSFKWSSLNLPLEVKNISHENICTHVYLEILINTNWVNMDATWDPMLKNIFTINQWNRNVNNIAVQIIEKFYIKKSQEIMKRETEDCITEDLKINGKFYKAFNNFLNQIRKECY